MKNIETRKWVKINESGDKRKKNEKQIISYIVDKVINMHTAKIVTFFASLEVKQLENGVSDTQFYSLPC